MENNCPLCKNHCTQNHLQCGRGIQYFSMNEGHQRQPGAFFGGREEKAVMLLRKCGHFLHHNAGQGGNTELLLQGLTEEEKRTLEILLEKCLKSWDN